MEEGTAAQPHPPLAPQVLHAYLLGTLPFDASAALQRRLVYDVAGDPDAGALVICDHPPGVTLGREGSRLDVRPGPEALAAREWPIRWLGRGGGTMLHLPGQVACYPIFSLDRLGLTVGAYLHKLQDVVVRVLAEYQVSASVDATRPGIVVNDRRIAHLGVSVRDRVTCFGVVLNVSPDLQPFREVHCDGDPTLMTSLQRESPSRVRIAGVRQRLVETIAEWFGFARVSLFHHHPVVVPAPVIHAVSTVAQ